MKSKISLALSLLILLSALSALTAQTAPPRAALQTARMAKLGSMPRSELLKQLGTTMTFEGFYYDGSVPMIVEDMSLVLDDAPLPPDKYVLLGGTGFSAVQPGTKVKITGLLQKPSSSDPEPVRTEGVILKVSDSKAVSTLVPTSSSLAVVDISQLQLPVGQPPQAQQVKYAILIGGGCDYANNYIRYWNDIKFTYYLLQHRGYEPANIWVLYANGVPRDGSTPVRGPSHYGAIQAVFNTLASKMKNSDKLFIGLYGQGDVPVADANHDEPLPPYKDSIFWLWNRVRMSDDMLAAQVNKIANYDRIVIQLNQGYSGGFIDDLTRPKRVVFSSSGPVQTSYAHPSNYFGHLNFWILSAHYRKNLLTGAPLNADTNGNGHISMVEAYNFARARVTNQTPMYEDNGVVPYRPGPMPNYGEGALGLNTYL